MTSTAFNGFEEFPMFLNAKMIAQILGISPSTAYLLLREEGFPTLKVGHRMVVPKDKFIQWIETNTGTMK